MLDVEKKDRVREYVKENPTASIREVAALFGVTYQQAYVLIRLERGPTRKKKAVKAKSKMSRKTILKKAAEQMRVTVKNLTDKIDSEPQHTTLNLLKPAVDMVNQPPHYTKGGIETIDFIEAKELNYNLGNVVKYVTRSGLKGTRIEDLKKAKWYLEREIDALLGG